MSLMGALLAVTYYVRETIRYIVEYYYVYIRAQLTVSGSISAVSPKPKVVVGSCGKMKNDYLSRDMHYDVLTSSHFVFSLASLICMQEKYYGNCACAVG